MSDILWGLFEIFVTFIEELIVFYFICSFQKHDFKTAKGKMVYFFGASAGTVVVTVVNSLTLYDWWTTIIYIAFWFLYAVLFIKGRTINKLLSAVISSAVLISVSNLITGSFSLVLKSDLDRIYSLKCLLNSVII